MFLLQLDPYEIPGLSTIQSLIHNLSTIGLKLVGALLILLIGWIVSKFVARISRSFLGRIGLDKLGEKLNNVDFVASSGLNIQLSKIISKFIYYILLIVFVIVATEALDMPAVSDLFYLIIQWIPNFIAAIIVLSLGIIVSDFLRKLVLTTTQSLNIPSAKLISSFVFYFLLVNVLIVALTQADINTDFIASNISIIIGGGVLAFAIGYGFASKNLLANLLSAQYNKHKVRIGDEIQIGSDAGKVVAIDKTSLTLRSEEKVIIIPLFKLTDEKIIIHKRIFQEDDEE